MPEEPEAGRWERLYVDLDMHRQLLYNTQTHVYVNREEQNGSVIDEAEARRLFPQAFPESALDA